MYLDQQTLNFVKTKLFHEQKVKAEAALLDRKASDYASYSGAFARLQAIRELEAEYERLIKSTLEYDEDELG